MIEAEEKENGHGGCECEQSSQSSYSPGVVLNDEIVIRTFFFPEHFEDGELNPKSITIEELQKRGCSVDRLDQPDGSEDNILARAQTKIRGRSNRQWIVLASLSVKEIRQFMDDANTQIFCVIDTALEDNRELVLENRTGC